MTLILTIVGWLLVALIGMVGALIVYARWHYGTLEALGIPVVKPLLFLGSNYMEPYVDVHDMDVQRTKQYGGIYGLYDGRRPQIYVSDPKLIRQISTVDFDSFRNHGWEFAEESTSIFENILDLLNDEKWRTVRGALTPIFTSGKIKQLNTVVKAIGDDYVEMLLTKCKGDRIEKIQFKEFVAPMLIEIVAKCFCGIEIPNAKDENNEFVRNMKVALLHDPQFAKEDWKTVVTKVFPFVMRFTQQTVDPDAMNFFVSAFRSILEAREKSGEASIDATAALVDMMKKVRSDPTYQRLGISESVVIAQGWEFFLAGYAGSRDAFEFFMYRMAANPAIQEQVYAEIEALQNEKGSLTLEAISNDLPLLTACITEAARMNQAFTRPERVCNQDWTYEGIRIPKGVQVVFSAAAVHMNPEYYADPETFDPWRFMGDAKKERDPYTFMTFGHGPRGCIGMRFANEMLKVLLVTFLSRFRVERRPDTVCERFPGGSFVITYKPIFLDLVRR